MVEASPVAFAKVLLYNASYSLERVNLAPSPRPMMPTHDDLIDCHGASLARKDSQRFINGGSIDSQNPKFRTSKLVLATGPVEQAVVIFSIFLQKSRISISSQFGF